MKKLLLVFAAVFTLAFSSDAQVYVSGYTKSNGTYVDGHYRTSPNSTRNDNYSTIGNVNPYTLEAGTKPRDSYNSNYYNNNSNSTWSNIPKSTNYNLNSGTSYYTNKRPKSIYGN